MNFQASRFTIHSKIIDLTKNKGLKSKGNTNCKVDLEFEKWMKPYRLTNITIIPREQQTREKIIHLTWEKLADSLYFI